jgi:hypothetical protein
MKRWKLMVAVLAVLAVAGTLIGATLTAKIGLTFATMYTGTGVDTFSYPVDQMNLSRTIDFTTGTGANQVNVVFHDSRSLADDVNEVLDFHGGALTDPLGTALTMDKLKVLYIKNTGTLTDIKIGGGADPIPLFANASDILLIKPGGTFVYAAPDANGLSVVDGNDLNILHGGGGTAAAIYEIIAIGVNAP